MLTSGYPLPLGAGAKILDAVKEGRERDVSRSNNLCRHPMIGLSHGLTHRRPRGRRGDL